MLNTAQAGNKYLSLIIDFVGWNIMILIAGTIIFALTFPFYEMIEELNIKIPEWFKILLLIYLLGSFGLLLLFQFAPAWQ
tara:strand:+ start:1069 stop:1308 length:240 start_codon:yes stop_codon:yes gene_type:complete